MKSRRLVQVPQYPTKIHYRKKRKCTLIPIPTSLLEDLVVLRSSTWGEAPRAEIPGDPGPSGPGKRPELRMVCPCQWTRLLGLHLSCQCNCKVPRFCFFPGVPVLGWDSAFVIVKLPGGRLATTTCLRQMIRRSHHVSLAQGISKCPA